MNYIDTLRPVPRPAARICTQRPPTHLRGLPRSAVLAAALLALGLALPLPAMAVDGCLVLLCLAAPNWRAIPQCVPPIRQLLRDLARGKAFPTCAMVGAGKSARHDWASAPANCPPQYTVSYDTESGRHYYCTYTGVITVDVAGQSWSRTWWRADGDSVTAFSSAAKAQLKQWDTRFDDDLATGRASPPPAQANCADC